jgi:hypothetical protein
MSKWYVEDPKGHVIKLLVKELFNHDIKPHTQRQINALFFLLHFLVKTIQK